MKFENLPNRKINNDKNKICVLIVDDEKELCNDIKKTLESISDNIDIYLATSGDQAIKILSNKIFRY